MCISLHNFFHLSAPMPISMLSKKKDMLIFADFWNVFAIVLLLFSAIITGCVGRLACRSTFDTFVRGGGECKA